MPQPDGPTMARNSPLFTVKEIDVYKRQEDTSGYAAFHAGKEASDDAAGYCLRMEGTLKDHGKYQWNAVCVKQDYAKGPVSYTHLVRRR